MTTSEGPVLELGEGFSDDAVSVLVDGRVVWQDIGVSTNYSVGLADIVPLPAALGATVEIRVRGSATSARLGAAGDAGGVGLRAVVGTDGAVTLGPASGGPFY